MNALSRFAPAVLSLLRIAAAYMFMLHGTAKFFSFPVSMGGGSPSGIYLAAAVLEVGGGILLLGLLTRPVAFILSGQMAVAYFMVYGARFAGQRAVPDCQRRRVGRAVQLCVPVSGRSRRRRVVAGQTFLQKPFRIRRTI